MKYIILLVTLTTVITTFIFVSSRPKQYESVAQLATGFTDKQEDRNENNPAVVNDKFSNLIELINSPNCVTLLSYKMMLHDLETKPHRSLQEITSRYSEAEIASAKAIYKNKLDSINILIPDNGEEERAIHMLKWMGYDDMSLLSKMEAKRVPQTDFIEISFKSENATLSAFAVNSYCQEIVRYYNFIRLNKIEKTLQYYTNLVSQKKQELDTKIDSLEQFKSSNSVTNYGLESQAKFDQLSKTQMSLDEENKKIISIRESIRTIGSQLSQENSNGTEEKNANTKIYELRKKISEMNTRYVSSGMKNSALGDSLRTMRAELDSYISKSGRHNGNLEGDLTQKKINLEIELNAAIANASALSGTINSMKSQLTGFTSKETSISALEMAVNVAKEEYLFVLDKFNAVKNASLNSGNLHQIKLGLPPDFPLSSNRILITLLAGIISMAFCVVGVFLLEYINLSYKTASNFQKQTELPVLGYLNELKTTKVDFEKLFSNSKNTLRLDAYKELLRKVRFETESTNAKTFLITSTKKGEGKSFTILSLAYSLKLSNKRVLLIDANFKDNKLTRMLAEDLPEDKTLNSEAMTNHSSAVDYNKLIHQTPISNVDIIGCSVSPLSPSEQFANGKLKELISSVAPRYDYIFIESPELNQFADTKELAPYSDKVIAVFSASSDLGQADKLSIEYLKSLNGKFAGGILNKVKMENLNA